MPTAAQLLTAWDVAVAAHQSAQNSLDAAGQAVRAARGQLALELLPDDAIVGEKFGVYVNTTLVQLTVQPGGDVVVTTRLRRRAPP